MTKRKISDISVLVVEDQLPVLEQMLNSLERLGVRKLACAIDLRTAHRFLPDHVPDLALLDFSLGAEGNTLCLAQRLQRLGARVVLISGYQAHELRAQTSDYEILQKPIRLGELRGVVLQSVGREMLMA